MDALKQINKFQELLEKEYKGKLLEQIRKGRPFLDVSFKKLSKFSPELAEKLLEQPIEVIKAAELSLDSFDIPQEQ